MTRVSRHSQPAGRGRPSKSTGALFREILPLPPAGLTLTELHGLKALEELQDLLDVLDGSLDFAEPCAARTSLISRASLFQAPTAVLVDEVASECLAAAQRGDLQAYRDGLVGWLSKLRIYALIGMELTSPAVRPRAEQWTAARSAAAASRARIKNRWTKRRSRVSAPKESVPTQALAKAERSLMAFYERVLLQRATADLPGADWELAIKESTDALISELGSRDVTPGFVSGLLRALQKQPGSWPELPTSAAVRKRIQRLR